MKPLSVIIIFTKDRPAVLSKTLRSIKNLGFQVIVLDDSYFLKNRITNKKQVDKLFASGTYHGRNEQKTFFKNSTIGKKLLKQFVNQLGSKKWNLGYARNYALMLTKSLKLKKILFMDDDIIVEDKNIIPKTFKLLDKYDFVGAKV